MLTPGERAYVDAYHAETLAKVGPLMDGEALRLAEGGPARRFKGRVSLRRGASLGTVAASG